MLILGNVLVNSPHYAATYYRVYRRKDQILKYPVEAVVAPAILALVAAACFVFPTALTPWVAFVYLATSGYHYAGQTYGVSIIFLGKSGEKLTTLQKRILQAPICAAYVYSVINMNVAGTKPSRDWKRSCRCSISLPRGSLSPESGVGVVMYLGLNVWFYRRNRRGLPPVVNTIVAAHAMCNRLIGIPGIPWRREAATATG